jgi:Cu(I)/Ag(I) efflux system membrane protein CusA/SilA
MIDRVLEFSVRHRRLVIAAGVLLAAGCVAAFLQAPVDAIPDLSENQVIVFTEWAGHGPREIEDQVTYPLSLRLQGLAGVRVVRSSSEVNFSMLHVIFEDDVDLEVARRRLGERLAEAGGALPPGVMPRLAPDASATGQIFWYTLEGPAQDLGRLRDLQDWYVRPQFQGVPGVAEVASIGGAPVEYQVEIDPVRLRAYGVPVGDVLRAVARSNGAAGGHVLQKANSEYLVQGAGLLGHSSDPGGAGAFDPRRAVRDLELAALPLRESRLCVGDLATVSLGPGFRRGVFEKDGSEVIGGVVLMRRGENPLEVTRRIKAKVEELGPGLPEGVRVVPCYDRTALIQGAVGTVTGTVLEAMITAIVCVLLVLLHFRASLVIALVLPLSAGVPFAVLWVLRRLGWADVPVNIMSLAGIAISVGVLVDSAVVMVENVMHQLQQTHGGRPVRGDVRGLVLDACRTVGRPLFLSVLVMLFSFLPVFALGGMEGKMFRPLAYTKSLALLGTAVLTVTLVPALCAGLIRGRLRCDEDSWLVRSVAQVYRPVLAYLLDRPGPLVWFLGVTLVVGLTPLGVPWIFLCALFLALTSSTLATRSAVGRAVAVGSLVLVALVADQNMSPLGREFMTPLDEGTVMDMPITVPRASVTQAADDLKARDMVLCRFPEVSMVVGKAGRAETPTDPAPLDMIETMIDFRPREHWPRRKLRPEDARRQARAALSALCGRGFVEAPESDDAAGALAREAAQAALPTCGVLLREHAYLRTKEFEEELGRRLVRLAVERVAGAAKETGALARNVSPDDLERLSQSLAHGHPSHLAMRPEPVEVAREAQAIARRLVQEGFAGPDAGPPASAGGANSAFLSQLQAELASRHAELWREHVGALDDELAARGAAVFTRLVVDELLARAAKDPEIGDLARQRRHLRQYPPADAAHGPAGHHHGASAVPAVTHRVVPELEWFTRDLVHDPALRPALRRLERSELVGTDGELDRAVQMPGWTNVWTMPIQNRVDMLATGVNTAVGVRVLGNNSDAVVDASERVAAALRNVPGAADVVADPVRGKGYLRVAIDREKAARHGVSAADVNDLVETALGGKVVTVAVEGRRRHGVRVRFARAWREDEEAVRNLPLAVPSAPVSAAEYGAFAAARPVANSIPLSDVADVHVAEGPAAIKGENGLLRNYVRLNVRDRDVGDFVDEARRRVADDVGLPEGVHLEWTGQFEHDLRARRALWLIVPAALLLTCLTLYATYRDWADAALVLLGVPGAVAGGVFFQWLFGYKFSVSVWIGYIACFGMAASTGVIMLVYLREAVARVGGLAHISRSQLRQAVLDGAVHRLRPKLLTEGTTILGLAPVLWATGVGSEVIKPMAAPVLGGLLVADEVIDLFLPLLFYRVRCRRWERIHGSAGGRVEGP